MDTYLYHTLAFQNYLYDSYNNDYMVLPFQLIKDVLDADINNK